MIAQAFDYQAPDSLAAVLQSLADARVKPLAGGMSPIPMMKLRLAAPEILVDLRRVPELRSIKVDDGHLAIGAMVTHYELESTPLVRHSCPLLAAAAASIGDVQVRNRGTIGGAIAHADPAADYPAALLAMDTELILASAHGQRSLPAEEFFEDTFTTALLPGELIMQVRIPVESPGTGTAYEKRVQSASGFAVVGIAARIQRSEGKVVSARVGVTGLGPKAYRAANVERLLEGTSASTEDIRQAAQVVAEGIDANSDVHASAEYRRHLARVLTARALSIATLRAEP
jgi:carbon-monoxide dehydrogenase medium subunit